MPAVFGAVAVIALLVGPGESAESLAAQARSEQLAASARNSALNQLGRVDRALAMSVAGELLQSPEPNLRLSAAWIRAKGGDRNGERALVRMVSDPDLRAGYRGLAAVRLSRLRSAQGMAAVVDLAQAVLRPGGAAAGEDLQGLRWELLDALGRYGRAEDLDLALSIYRATGLKAPARPIGLFGRSESLPLLREAAVQERNASAYVQIQLAIARSGGPEGAAFVHELMARAALLDPTSEVIDLQKEDPLSGRLAGDVLWDFGSHRSDVQFREDVISLLSARSCQFCDSSWAAIARLGVGTQEKRLVEIATRNGSGGADAAMKVLAYGGSETAVRKIAKQLDMAKTAEVYIQAHRRGEDREWFPVSAEAE